MLLIRVLGILAMCSMAIWSLLLGSEDLATAKLLVTAYRLESPGFVLPSDIDSLNTDRALSTCRSLIVTAAARTLLADWERQKALQDKAAWLTARQRADAVIEHALTCEPGDGEAWAHSAQQSQAEAAWPDAVASLSMSQRLAPADAAILRARIEVWTNVPASGAAPAEASLRSDIQIILEHGQAGLLRLLLASAPAWMLPTMREAFEALPPPRQTQIAQLLPALASAVGPSA